MHWKIGIVLLIALMASSGAATSIQSEDITIDLADNSVSIESEIETITSSKFSYVTTVPVTNVEGEMNGETIECNASEFQIGSEIQCEAPEKNNVSLKLDFTASNLVEKRNGYSLFQYSHSVYRPTDNYQLTVLLPEDSAIADNSNRSEETVIPESAEIDSSGDRTSITWDLQPQLGQVLSFRAIYEEDTSQSKSNFSYLLAGLLIIGSLAVAYILTREPKGESIDLEDDEQKVVDILLENNGEMLQKDVVSESEYSKAKISGVVSSLVDKEVVSKEKEGRSNKLVLEKKVK
ncbi:MAG: putative membrane protein [Candidatus Nanohaloarchaea archaeon]|jgi:uncharacterized membrane protein